MGTLLEPAEVAECAIRGIEKEDFLILPHPEVKGYLQRKAKNIDQWLSGMRRFLARVQSPQASVDTQRKLEK